MNEQLDLERRVAAWFAEEGAPMAPQQPLNDIITATGRMRPLPRWLALLKEPPMRISSAIAVGSPTARVAAILVATFLLAVSLAAAGIAGSRLLAADGPIVVDQSGDGHFTTISEAVVAAQDGDTVLIRPGTYHESVIIDKDITLTGDGERESVIIEVGDDGPTYDGFWYLPSPYGILLDDSNAEVSNVTVHLLAPYVGEVGPTAFVARGGAPLIHDVTADHPRDGLPQCCPGPSIYLHGGSAGTVRDSLLEGWVFVHEASPATLDGNLVGWSIVVNAGDAAVNVLNNTTDGIWYAGTGTISGNTVAVRDGHDPDIDYNGIHLDRGDFDASVGGWTVSGNTVRGAPAGIRGANVSSGSIQDNVLVDNDSAILLGGADSTFVVDGNTIEGGGSGLLVTSGDISVSQNSIHGVAGTGLGIGGTATAVLRDNTSCDNGTNAAITPNASVDVDDSNIVCEDAPAL